MGSSSMGSLGAGPSLTRASVLLPEKWVSHSLPRILPRSVLELEDDLWVYSFIGYLGGVKTHETLITITSCVRLLTVILISRLAV